MMKNQLTDTDIVVVGGGMTGGALAIGLARRGFQVVVLEQVLPNPFCATQPPDVRVSAISQGSVKLLEQLRIWQRVREMRCHPWRRLETWERDNARVIFDAQELHLTQLGYMVENPVLQYAIWQEIQACPSIKMYAPVQLSDVCRQGDIQQLTLDDGQKLTARLVIGADGASSQVRYLAGIGLCGWRYQQDCLLVTVRCDNPPGDSTWQQFTPDGPVAFLPLFEQWATLVWYHHPARIRQLQAMNATQLAEQIHQHFPARLGRITPQAWSAFPLIRRHAFSYVQPGFVLAGDAAHTIHPLAGQGVNLGYRDVWTLLEVLGDAKCHTEQWYSDRVLKRYQKRRMADNHLMQMGMDVFYVGFSQRSMPLKIVRNLGFMVAQRAGILKQQVLKYALGI